MERRNQPFPSWEHVNTLDQDPRLVADEGLYQNAQRWMDTIFHRVTDISQIPWQLQRDSQQKTLPPGSLYSGTDDINPYYYPITVKYSRDVVGGEYGRFARKMLLSVGGGKDIIFIAAVDGDSGPNKAMIAYQSYSLDATTPVSINYDDNFRAINSIGALLNLFK